MSPGKLADRSYGISRAGLCSGLFPTAVKESWGGPIEDASNLERDCVKAHGERAHIARNEKRKVCHTGPDLTRSGRFCVSYQRT